MDYQIQVLDEAEEDIDESFVWYELMSRENALMTVRFQICPLSIQQNRKFL
jgi:hypothetical protein